MSRANRIAARTAFSRGFTNLMASTALVALPTVAVPQDCALVDGRLPESCESLSAGSVASMPVGRNAEPAGSSDGLSGEGFAITINGATPGPGPKRVASGPSAADVVRQQDVRLDEADVRVSYDGLYAERRLNVATADMRSAFGPSEAVSFRSSMNYPQAITRAEVLITPKRDGLGMPKTQAVPIAPNGEANWRMPALGAEEYTYVLRVYDAEGRFDETEPSILRRETKAMESNLNGPVIAAGEGEDRTRLRTIPVDGGAVTVSGTGLPPNATVLVMGEAVPVDPDGGFVTERLLPFGEHDVTVAMSAPGATGYTLEREVIIPRSEWFATGIADFTYSRRGPGSLSDAESKTEARLAFYAKGVVNGRYRVTASADTGEQEVSDLFSGFFDKTPGSVLDRIDPDELYPTYGDDSTIIEDAPTSGRIYVKVEDGDSHILWGDFRNRIEGTEYLRSSRNLYGAQVVYNSPRTTVDGERRTELTFYAAQPDSLPQRDILRGTGGSAYFLKRQDILPGTETLSVEVQDPDSGRVISTRRLVVGKDYRIDYIQGTVILDEPLTASSGDGAVVSGSVSGDYNVNLVAQYEYVPTLSDVDGTAFGGRAEVWLPGDRVRLGFSGMDETTEEADLRVIGADVQVRLGANSYVEAEIAESRGRGFGRSVSTDGGLTYNDIPDIGAAESALAGRVEASIDLADVAPGRRGSLSAYYETKEAGFTTLSEDIDADQTSWGFAGAIGFAQSNELRFRYDDFDEDGGDERREGYVDLAFTVSPGLIAEAGVRHLDAFEPGDPEDTGSRTDFGLRLTREYGNGDEAYIFAQATVDRSGGLGRNDRIGVGGSFTLTETLSVDAEVSEGSTGFGARAQFEYQPNDDARYYLGYTLDPDRELSGHTLRGRDSGAIVVGAERRYSDTTSAYAENNYDMFGKRRSLTSAYGITYTPTNAWTYSGGLEYGTVQDDINGDFDRTALSLGAKYDNGQGITGRLRAELRFEDHETDQSRDRETYLLSGAYSYKVDDNWRFLADADVLVSESDQSDFLDGRYIEANLGFAYRPIDNDRLNALFRYTYLEDIPGVDQVSADGTTAGDKQRSHILSADAIYEVNENWEIGGKLAYRKSETAPRSGGSYTDNDAVLAALRATYHVVHEWDVSAEVRSLSLPSADAQEYGAVISAYRHVNNNLKVGVGYNFGTFSDDLRDVSLDDKGLFLNLVAKF